MAVVATALVKTRMSKMSPALRLYILTNWLVSGSLSLGELCRVAKTTPFLYSRTIRLIKLPSSVYTPIISKNSPDSSIWMDAVPPTWVVLVPTVSPVAVANVVVPTGQFVVGVTSVNCVNVDNPNGPVTPVAPVGPVTPVYPVAPVYPVTPV